jgi:hypothetical protein
MCQSVLSFLRIAFLSDVRLSSIVTKIGRKENVLEVPSAQAGPCWLSQAYSQILVEIA